MQTVKTERRCYNVREAAQVLGIGERLLRDQIKKNLVPCLKLGGAYRIPIKRLNDYINGDLKKEGLIEES